MEHLLKDIPGISATKCEQLVRHWQLLVHSEDYADLTRLKSSHDIALKHYLDCALPLKFLDLPSPLLDIGSGAGFPGLVFKILSPATEVILGEFRPKRVRFLQQAIAELGLTGITIYPHRIGPQFPLAVRAVVTRALESARDTLYRAAPFLPEGGKVILLKGPRGEEEIVPALSEFPEFAHEATHRYTLAGTSNERQLIVFRRIRESIRAHKIAAKQIGPRESEITSRANEFFKMLLSLTEARGIRKHQKFLVSGQKLVNEVLRDRALAQNIEALIRAPAHTADTTSVRQIVLAPALFRELDSLGTGSPILLLRIEPMRSWDVQRDRDGVTVFVPFQDPTNVGAAIRSAAAFGARRVVLLKEAASPYLPKAVRAAAGATFRIELLQGPPLAELVHYNEKILRLDLEGACIADIEIGRDTMLLAGIEGYGFTERGKTIPVTIPISRGVESLNAQVALAIALYEIQRRKK